MNRFRNLPYAPWTDLRARDFSVLAALRNINGRGNYHDVARNAGYWREEKPSYEDLKRLEQKGYIQHPFKDCYILLPKGRAALAEAERRRGEWRPMGI